MSDICWSVDLGRRDYEEIWRLQKELVEKRRRDLVPDLLLFVEHTPTYTIGRGGRIEHVLADPATLARLGARVVTTDRGGDVTFHGPGQVVGYPILDLRRFKRDVHAYLRALEETVIVALAELGVPAHREAGLTGVWHASGKLAAIGVRVSHWVTSHGFALNVSNELEYFNHIVPCGIVGRNVSSVTTVLRRPMELAPVRYVLRDSFGSTFSRAVTEVSEADVAAITSTRTGTSAR